MFETLRGWSDIERVGAVDQPYWKICGELEKFEAEVTSSVLLSRFHLFWSMASYLSDHSGQVKGIRVGEWWVKTSKPYK